MATASGTLHARNAAAWTSGERTGISCSSVNQLNADAMKEIKGQPGRAWTSQASRARRRRHHD